MQILLNKENGGNGAMEMLEEYFAAFPNVSKENRVTHLLAWLAIEGFIIVPMEGALN